MREETREKFLNITPEDLWRLQKILSNKKESLSQTYKKNTEANANVCDFNQKTMQALETLAAVYAVFEKAGENLNVETSEVLCADGRAATEEFNERHHNQEHMRGVLHDFQESLGNAFIDFNVACRGLEGAQLLPYLKSMLLSHHSSGSLHGALSLASHPIPILSQHQPSITPSFLLTNLRILLLWSDTFFF